MSRNTRSSLQADLLVAETATSAQLRQLANRHNLSFAGISSINRVREVMTNHLKDAIAETSEGSAAADALPRGSLSDSKGEGSPIEGRRLSYSMADVVMGKKESALTPTGKTA